MFSLKGETNAAIPATSSSHTSGAPRCAMWCSVLHSSSYRRRAYPCHRRTGAREEEDYRSGQRVFPGHRTHRETGRFFRGCCPPASHSPQRWHPRIDQRERVSCLLLCKPCKGFHVTDIVCVRVCVCAGDREQTACLTPQPCFGHRTDRLVYKKEKRGFKILFFFKKHSIQLCLFIIRAIYLQCSQLMRSSP